MKESVFVEVPEFVQNGEGVNLRAIPSLVRLCLFDDLPDVLGEELAGDRVAELGLPEGDGVADSRLLVSSSDGSPRGPCSTNFHATWSNADLALWIKSPTMAPHRGGGSFRTRSRMTY